MKTIAVFEIANAVFIGVTLIGQLNRHDKSRGARWLRLTLISAMIHLFIDAMAYTLTGERYPFALRYAVNLLAYSMSGIDMLCFIMYCKNYISGKVSMKRSIFRIPLIATGICTIASFALFIAGKLIVYDNGTAVQVNDIPLWLRLFEILVMLYTPLVLVHFRKEIGWKAALLMGFYCFTPIITGFIARFTGVDYSIIIGAISVQLVAWVVQDEEQNNLILINAEQERSRKEQVAMMMGGVSAYIVNPETGRFQIISQNSHLAENYTAEDDFNTSLSRYIRNEVFEPDRKMVSEKISVPAMVKALENEESYTVRFRDTSSGYPRWYEMRAVKLSDTEILYGFSDREDEINAEMLYDKLSDNYFGLYYINLDTALAQVIKTGHPELTGKAGAVIAYSNLIKNIASCTDGDALGFLNRISDINYLRAFFADKDYAYEIYKSNIFDEINWVNATGMILARREDGTPSIFGLGLSLLDSVASEKEEAKQKLQETLENEIERTRDEKAYQLAILNNAYSYFRINLSQNRIIPPIIEREHGQPVDYTGKFPTPLPSYESVIEAGAERYVDESYKESYRRYGSCEYLIGCFNEGNLMPEYICHIYSTTIGWHYRKYVTYLSKDDASGDIFGMTVAYDVTKEFEAAERERQYKADLEEARFAAESANNYKTDFLFSMSHDIRTPMNAITGFTAMAKKYIDNKAAVSDYLDKIDSSGKQLLSLVNNVLEMARIESGKIELEEKPVNIRQEFNATTTVLSEQAQMNGQEFNYALEGMKHFNVLADESKVSSIVMNIISNALKYTPEGGSIDFRLKEIKPRKPGYATYVFTVKDTGIGMSKEFLKTLFDPFAREKTSTVSGIQGTGLGMAIVKRFIDNMGGDIAVESEQGKGTRFDVTLDFRIDAEAAEPKVQEDILKTSFKGLKILLVEDNELNREIAIDILEDEGMKVDAVTDGVYAVETMKEKGPDYYDIILMDIQMPLMNGYEATKAIRAMYPDKHIPIIALSANAFEEDRIASRNAGLDDHVAKPIVIKDLFAALAKFMQF